jgi:DNA-binding XRE family transcriptional regulator
MTDVRVLKKKWMKDPQIRSHYEIQAPEFAIARVLIEARTRVGLTQEEIAERMGTTQSAVARLESGRSLPSIKSLYRYARATGTTPVIQLITL